MEVGQHELMMMTFDLKIVIPIAFWSYVWMSRAHGIASLIALMSSSMRHHQVLYSANGETLLQMFLSHDDSSADHRKKSNTDQTLAIARPAACESIEYDHKWFVMPCSMHSMVW